MWTFGVLCIKNSANNYAASPEAYEPNRHFRNNSSSPLTPPTTSCPPSSVWFYAERSAYTASKRFKLKTSTVVSDHVQSLNKKQSIYKLHNLPLMFSLLFKLERLLCNAFPHLAFPHLILCLTFITGSPTALAQEKVIQESPVQQIEIRGEQKKFMLQREDTVSKVIIKKNEIEKYGDTHIKDVLNRQLGVIGGSLHGLTGYTQILIDGQRMPAGLTLNDVLTSDIESIEITRSAIAENSTQAIAGSINLIRRKKISSARKSLGLNLSGVPSVKFSKIATFQITDQSDHTSYDLSIRSINNFRNDTSLKFDESKLMQENLITSRYENEASITKLNGLQITPSIIWKNKDTDTISITGTYSQHQLHRRANATIETNQKLPSSVHRIFSSSSVAPSRKSLELKWIHHFENQARLSNELTIRRYTYRSGDSLYSKMINESGHLIQERTIQVQTLPKEWIVNGNLTRTLWENQTLKFGWNLTKQKESRTYDSSDTGIDFAAATTSSMAFFGQSEWILSDVWAHYVGLRWESFQTQGHGNTFASFKNDTSVLSPIVQSKIKVPNSPENQFRLAIARTFKNPDLKQLYREARYEPQNTINTPDEIGNADLRPEIALGLNLWFEHFGENELNYSMSLYAKRLSSVIRRNLIFRDERWEHNYVNDGEANARGFELEVQTPLHNLIGDSRNIKLKAHLTRNWSETNATSGPNNRLAAQAPLAVGAQMEFDHQRWATGISFNFTQPYQAKVSETSSQIYAAQRDLSGFINFNANKDVKIKFAIDNLLQNPIIAQTNYRDSRRHIYTVTKHKDYRQLKLSMSINL